MADLWAGRVPSKPYSEQLPEMIAERLAWERDKLPALRARTAAQEEKRAKEAAELAEARKALAWCRANGNPHIAGGASD